MGKLPDVITKVMRNGAKKYLPIFLNHLPHCRLSRPIINARYNDDANIVVGTSV